MELEIKPETFNHKNKEDFDFKVEQGLSKEVVEIISKYKNEPEWMLNKRLKCLELFNSMSMPNWGPSLSGLDINKITFFADPSSKKNAKSWEDLPEDIKKTFDKLGIPKAERESLAGAGSQYESMSVYHNLKKEWAEKGVIFEDFDIAVKEYPELVQKYFMTKCVSPALHKFAALHGAVFSGGTFIYIPKGVKVTIPLQAYFRMNSEKMGQFEHTLIIVDEGAEIHYIEGCSSPLYTTNSLHAGCVEIIVMKNAKARYTSIENWSKNTFNLNTKRAVVEEDGTIEWINANMGCLTEDTKVFTNPKGPVNIDSINKGDKVYVWDEKTNSIKKSKVKTKIISGEKEVYRLEAGGREINASANHPFLTLVRKKNKSSHKKGFFHYLWKSLDELKVNDLICISKKLPIDGKSFSLPRINTDEIVKSKNQYAEFKMNISHLYNKITIPKETNEDFMWLMGILLGDGYIYIKNNNINIATHITEDYRENLCELLHKLFNYNVTEKKERYIMINSKVLCNLFSKIGFSGTASTKIIPSWVFTLPENQILAFLSGYFDSDGHFANGSLAFTSVNKNILENVRNLAMMVGFGTSRIFSHRKAGKKIVVGHLCNTKDSWRIHLTGKKIKELPVRCLRKKLKIEKSNPRRNYVSAKGFNIKSKTNDEIGFAKINKIISLGIKPTYDIEVEDYHNFIANGIVVHNSNVTMLYPCSVLVGTNAKSEYLGMAFAGKDQIQDTGAKIYHLAPNTNSIIKSKSISTEGGTTTYRGIVKIGKNAKNSKVSVECDALMTDSLSTSNTIPYIDVNNKDVNLAHEATVGSISDEAVFYLMSRGLSEDEAKKMIVHGFLEEVSKQLPIEYAVEFNKLIELEMEGSLG